MELTMPFSVLPMELVFHVFDLAAATCCESTVAISLVSSHARRLVQRYLFSTLAIRRPAPTSVHLCTASYTRHLRYLWLENGTPFEEVPHAILFHIQETVTHLALPAALLALIMTMPPSKWSRLRHIPVTPSTSDSDSDAEDDGRTPRHPCRELTVLRDDLSRTRSQLYNLPATPTSVFGAAFLGGLTHIRLLARRDLLFLPLAHLVALTHVALPADPGELWDTRTLEPRTTWLLQLQHTSAGTEDRPRLRMVVLVLQWYGEPLGALQRRQLALAARARDERLYVAEAEEAQDEKDAVREWKRAVRGAGDSVWERAVWARDDALGACGAAVGDIPSHIRAHPIFE